MRRGGAVLVAADDLRVEAFAAEALGVAPPRDLAPSILLRLQAPPAVVPVRARRLPAALLLAAGVAVAVGVGWLEHRPDPIPAPADQPLRQEPQQPDPKTKNDPGQWIRDLKLADRRAAAITALRQSGKSVVTALQAAADQERKRGRTELLGVIEDVITRIGTDEGKVAFGLPAGEVTVVSDYSENCVCFFDAQGQKVKTIENVLGPWDASLTAQGTLLLTEFSISRVREIDAKGKTLWEFEDLKSPYSASRLANGNTLIADTFNGRVIEVTPEKKIVWSYDTEIRPFDCERLADGNTLIADVLKDRVFEVDAKGNTVWEQKRMNNVHDADRLPNGNTLVTLRATGRVLELDPAGNTVFELRDLASPSDAEWLPNGNTLVAEHGQVREFDPQGKQVWRVHAEWAVRVHRY
jgi:hypothetical protein